MAKLPQQKEQKPGSCTYHLLGFVTGGLGLGESSRQTLQRMQELNIALSVRNVDSRDHRAKQISGFEQILETRRKHWPGHINLIHVNPPEFGNLILDQYPNIPAIRNLNVIIPFWELPVLTESWILPLEAMDCVLAPTRFIQETISKHFPDKPIIHYPQSVNIKRAPKPDRARFELPDDAFVFLCGFDAMSCMERKNPMASIAAFKKAFQGGEKVRLLIKVSNPDFDGAREKLEQMKAGDDRIVIYSEILPREELEQLYASCDALISLHRSEGLGLFIMEMMAQAKPTIVTAWSGNMDFTTPENSCLVDFKMVPVQSRHPAYQFCAKAPEACWADADTDCAAGWMRALVADRQLCARIGKQAHETMAQLRENDCAGVFAQLEEMHRHGFKRSKQARSYIRKKRLKHLGKKIERSFKRVIGRTQGRP